MTSQKHQARVALCQIAGSMYAMLEQLFGTERAMEIFNYSFNSAERFHSSVSPQFCPLEDIQRSMARKRKQLIQDGLGIGL